MEYSSNNYYIEENRFGHYIITDIKTEKELYLQDEYDINEINQKLENYWKGKRGKRKNSGKFLDNLFDSDLSEYFG
jgi:hypothetical protein